jgi:hypothetical protein
MEGCLMVGSISARTLDYFGLLVAASVIALCSAGSLRTAFRSCCEERHDRAEAPAALPHPDRLGRPPRKALSFLAATTNICVRSSEGSLVDTVEHAEMVEKQLDAMIQRRARKGDVDPDEREELWKASVRAYEEKRRRMARLEWHLHHTAQAERLRRTLEALASHHEEQAAKLLDVRPKGA